MPSAVKDKPAQGLHSAVYALPFAAFFLAVALHLLLQTLELRAVELAPLPLLQPGSTCYATLTLDYTIPDGLPLPVEESLLQIKKWRMRPVFSVSDPEIAAVTADGKITGLQNGVTTLSVTIGGLCRSAELVVGGTPVQELQLVLFSDRLTVGSTIVPGVRLSPADADYYTDVEISSSDDSILRKNADGSFTAVSAGVVELYACLYSEQKIETSCTLYVTGSSTAGP